MIDQLESEKVEVEANVNVKATGGSIPEEEINKLKKRNYKKLREKEQELREKDRLV